MRLYVRMRAVLAGTEAMCTGSVRPVDGPVKRSAAYGVYRSDPLSSTPPKLRTYQCDRDEKVGQ